MQLLDLFRPLQDPGLAGSTGGQPSLLKHGACRPVSDERVAALTALAGETSIVIGFHEDSDTFRTYNSAAYLESGTLVHLHRKLYLPTYGIFEERKFFSPGQSMRAFGTKFGRMAVLICNDAWQPALGFLAVQDGARVLLVPT